MKCNGTVDGVTRLCGITEKRRTALTALSLRRQLGREGALRRQFGRKMAFSTTRIRHLTIISERYSTREMCRLRSTRTIRTEDCQQSRIRITDRPRSLISLISRQHLRVSTAELLNCRR